MENENEDVLIVYISYHHNNTENVVREIGGELNARLVDLENDRVPDLTDYELLGFGSGIYFGKHHKKLLEFVDDLPDFSGKKAFLFATSGLRRLPVVHRFEKRLKSKVQSKKFDLVGEFYCRGYDTYSLLKYIGGIQNGHPDAEDLTEARRFAADLKNRLEEESKDGDN